MPGTDTGSMGRGVLAAVGGTGAGEQVVETAAALAAALDVSWHVVFVETPRTAQDGAIARRAADTLALAARLGATVSRESAHDVVDGLIARLAVEPARHLVIGVPSSLRDRYSLAPTLLRDLVARRPDLTVHLAPVAPSVTPALAEKATAEMSLAGHGIALGAVVLTLCASYLLSLVVSGRPLSLLFLFPVIAVAARFGLGPAITAVVSAVLSFDLFLLPPVMQLNPLAPVNIVLWIALGAVAVYTSFITGALRNRVG